GTIYEGLEGIFLTGGIDVDPSSYGESRHPLCGATDPPRDWTELTLVRWAMSDDKPVLGVCRGIQAINVAAGGTLYQDVGAQHPGAIKHDYFSTPGGPHQRDSLTPPIRLEARSPPPDIIGAEGASGSSIRHQGIKTHAPGR